eukprot:g33676.t1
MSQDDAWLWQIFQRLQDAPDMMKAEKMANAMRMTGLNPTEAEAAGSGKLHYGLMSFGYNLIQPVPS